MGKTRLLGEVGVTGRQLGLAVMTGRAPVATPMAFSVVCEALRSWLRAHPADAAMAPYDAGLRLVVPEWPVGADAAGGLTDAQLRLLAFEGVVRLVQHIAATSGGAVVVLDDLHAADPDSLEAIRYLAAARLERVLVVGALRSGESAPAEHMVRALQRDGVADVFDLVPLDRRAVTALLGALLDAEPPGELVDDVVVRTDGVPLLVEEVLEAHLRAGTLEVGDRGASWRGGNATVTRTVRDMVEGRAPPALAATTRRGDRGRGARRFRSRVARPVAQQPPAALGDAIAAATDARLARIGWRRRRLPPRDDPRTRCWTPRSPTPCMHCTAGPRPRSANGGGDRRVDARAPRAIISPRSASTTMPPHSSAPPP